MWLGKIGAIRGSDILIKMGKEKLGLDQDSLKKHVAWERKTEVLEKIKEPCYDENGKMYFVFIAITKCTEIPVFRYYPNEQELERLNQGSQEKELTFNQRTKKMYESILHF